MSTDPNYLFDIIDFIFLFNILIPQPPFEKGEEQSRNKLNHMTSPSFLKREVVRREII